MVDPVFQNAGNSPSGIAPMQMTRQFKLYNLNLNSAATDVGTFTGLPSVFRVIRFTAYNASTTPTLATIDLRTAAGGGGSAIVSAQTLTALTAANVLADVTLALANQTFSGVSSLTVRNVTANGSALTCSFFLEVEDLS